MWSIDPAEIEWCSSKYQRGRRTTITIEFLSRTQTREKATLCATPEKAQATIDDLEKHSNPGDIKRAEISTLLHEIAQNTQARRRYVLAAANIKISVTPVGAQALLDDLRFWTIDARSNPALIRHSVVGTFLQLAKNASMTRRAFIFDTIKEGARRYGPWIYSFAKRFTGGVPNADDAMLLDRILAHAQSAGYDRVEGAGTPPAVRERTCRWACPSSSRFFDFSKPALSRRQAMRHALVFARWQA